MTTSDGTHTLHRIDVKDQLPREETWVLVWGHLKSHGWRWVHVLWFEKGKFIDQAVRDLDPDEGDYTDLITHWAPLEPLNWNDGLPLHRSYIQ